MAAQSFLFDLLFIGHVFVRFFFLFSLFMVKKLFTFLWLWCACKLKITKRTEKKNKHPDELHCIYKIVLSVLMCVIKSLNSWRISCEKPTDDNHFYWLVAICHNMICCLSPFVCVHLNVSISMFVRSVKKVNSHLDISHILKWCWRLNREKMYHVYGSCERQKKTQYCWSECWL